MHHVIAMRFYTLFIASNLHINGIVTLNSDLTFDTGSGAGNITFTAANSGTGRIDSQAGEHNDLVLRDILGYDDERITDVVIAGALG